MVDRKPLSYFSQNMYFKITLFCKKKHQNSHFFRSNIRIHKCYTILERSLSVENEKKINSNF
jgi:hypothetical protein